MKKYLLLLLAVLPMMVFLPSCSDDDDLPNVSLDFAFDGATDVDGTLYVVQGQPFSVTGITVTNNEQGKGAGISGANYYWDYNFVGSNVVPPYGYEFQISENAPLGNHFLEVQSTVFAVDKTLATSVTVFRVVVVASADDIPAGGNTGSTTVTPQISASK